MTSGATSVDARDRRGGRGFDAAFDRLYDGALELATSLVGDAVLGEEITIEALARVCAEWRRIARRVDPGLGALRVVLEQAIEAMARREPIAAVDLDGDATAPSESARLAHDEAVALRALTRRRREIVALSLYGGLTDAEIATLLRVSVRTVASEQRAAREELARALGVAAPPSASGAP